MGVNNRCPACKIWRTWPNTPCPGCGHRVKQPPTMAEEFMTFFKKEITKPKGRKA